MNVLAHCHRLAARRCQRFALPFAAVSEKNAEAGYPESRN